MLNVDYPFLNFFLNSTSPTKPAPRRSIVVGSGIGETKGYFSEEAFSYDSETDAFICPAGEVLRKRNYNKKRKHYQYKATSGTCA
jgi:hypothetical protein